MLTKVILDGPLGKAFGRTWELSVNSPREALAMVNANKPGVFNWIRANLSKYENYRVHCVYVDGTKEDLDTETYSLEIGKLKSIRFSPVTKGSSAIVRIVIGVMMVIWGDPATKSKGLMLILSGVVELMTAIPLKVGEVDTGKKSYYFDGPINTEQQGVPVPLIFGTVLTGSHSISAKMSIDQLL